MGFRTILIGFIFVFFNINFGKVNLLPDVIGYIIVLIGTYTLTGHFKNQSFFKVRHSSIILIVLSCLELFVKHSLVLNGIINDPQTLEGKIFLILFYLLNTLILTYCLFHLCMGIKEEAMNKENIELAEKAKKAFIVFALYEAFFFLLTLIGTLTLEGISTTTLQGSGSLLFFLLLIIVIFVFLRLFLLLNKAEKTLSKDNN